MRVGMDVNKFSLLGVGLAAALWTTPSALADPVAPLPPPPAPVVTAAGDVVAPPAPDPLAFLRPPAPAAPAPDAEPAAEPAAAPAPPAEVPHLVSPENLPPGSTMDPAAKSTENPRLSYLKDLWQGVQNQEISAKEALIWGLAQRGMNTPYPEQAAGPNVPVSGTDLAAAPPPPADAPPPPADAPPPAPAPVLP
ncbi:hypothetical protein ABGB19_13735 [Mycobacterium sp. B14F4]|uniref:hypothetical protein n=1 Tax=Mycobacterium sp. B14F4 TaxID=3153565 RepID=UPI00325C6687